MQFFDVLEKNAVLFAIIFGAKTNKCKQYLKIKMLIFRFHEMEEKFL
jgi:hypothetical protein